MIQKNFKMLFIVKKIGILYNNQLHHKKTNYFKFSKKYKFFKIQKIVIIMKTFNYKYNQKISTNF